MMHDGSGSQRAYHIACPGANLMPEIGARLSCPYLRGEVDLSEDRERHIADRHPDLLPEYRPLIAETLATPDQVRRSQRLGSVQLFSRWYTGLKGGKHVVVTLAKAPMPPSSFAEEPDGELLMTGFSGRNGKIFRLVPEPAK